MVSLLSLLYFKSPFFFYGEKGDGAARFNNDPDIKVVSEISVLGD